MHILEDEFPFGMAHFQGRTVSFREGKFPLLRFRAVRSCPQNLAHVEILEILEMCRIFSSLLVALDGRRVAFVASRICCHTAKPRTKYMRLGILWWNFMRFGALFHHGTLVLGLVIFTLPETSSFAPENVCMVGRRSFPFGMAYFQVRLLVVLVYRSLIFFAFRKPKKGEYSWHTCMVWWDSFDSTDFFDAFFMAQHGPPKKRWSETVWSLLQVLIPLIRRCSQRDTVDPKIGAGTFG